MSYMNKAEADMQTMAVAVGMAVTGGLANFLKGDGPRNWGKMLAAVLTSAFAGLLSYEITLAMGFDVHVQCIVAGIAGYGGGTMLDETYQKIHDFIMKKADDHITGQDSRRDSSDAG